MTDDLRTDALDAIAAAFRQRGLPVPTTDRVDVSASMDAVTIQGPFSFDERVALINAIHAAHQILSSIVCSQTPFDRHCPECPFDQECAPDLSTPEGRSWLFEFLGYREAEYQQDE